MVMWYKIPSDSPIPQTRQLLLERLHQTCRRNDPEEPAIPFLVALPQYQEPMDHQQQEPEEGVDRQEP